ncbi:LysR family transcriptional regulator [Salinisphaera sp. Q1T1-3]|uniref:LysR family transcriptional regulator n=1 Tax=Salinisphaera sp. Q1T1-3 TaxID=2321229 RepID=UPI000E70A620|nr:LysR family transcriptional regulator [Salinisphaera sp. Q1T1-3]RJS94174.1 LysR family transcriptional regulator [Salinisphaera sp. Q1T1-3]
MNIRDVDLNLLVMLDALLREKSVTRAARAMDITQPAMSNALKRLRKLLGDPILVRTAQGMQPTARAEQLHRPVRNALSQMEAALAPNRAFEPATAERLFTVLITDYAASVLMPHIVGVLEREAPHIALNILSAGTDAIDQVERGEADFLINEFGRLPANFHQQRLWTDRLACLIRADHPALLADGGRLTLETFVAQRHVLITQTGVGLSHIDEVLADLGLSRQISVLTRHYQLPRELVAQSDMIVALPARIARYQARHLGLAVHEPPLTLPAFEIGIAWGALDHHDIAHRWLRERIIRIARETIT